MFSRRITLTAVCLATAMLMLDIAVVNTALPRIARSLHSDVSGIQWVVDAYTLVLAATVLIAGSLSDRLGRRRGLLAGLGLFTAASVACATANSIALLDVARAIQGLGAAAMFATSLAVLGEAFTEPAERARGFAAYGATVGGSFAVGPLVGGLLTSHPGWRAIFFVNIPLGLVTTALVALGVRESLDPRPRRLDLPGQTTLSAGLLLLVLALLRGGQTGWASPTILAELSGAAGLLVTFVTIEWRRPEPMLPLGMFRNPSFTGAQVAAFCISGSFFAVMFYMTVYLQLFLHLSPIRAGLVYLPVSMLVFLVSGASAQLAARVPARVLVAGGLALVSAGLATCVIAGERSSWAALMPGLLLAALGTGLFNPALSAVALGEAPFEQSGLAAGVNDGFRQLGVAVGVAGLGTLIPTASLLGGHPGGFVVGFHRALVVSAALAGTGAVASWRLIRTRPASAGSLPGVGQADANRAPRAVPSNT